MKHIDDTNKEEINKINIHDSFYDGFQYDYESRTIKLCCENYYLKKTFTFIFHNVILFEMQRCTFWGTGNRIRYISITDDPSFVGQYQELHQKEETWIKNSCLDQGIVYMPIEIQINSGDMLYLLCESVDFFEKDLDVEESRKRRETSITKNWIE